LGIIQGVQLVTIINAVFKNKHTYYEPSVLPVKSEAGGVMKQCDSASYDEVNLPQRMSLAIDLMEISH
jgi:hypothetical protein